MRRVLVIDAGTSGVRAAVIGADAAIVAVRHREVLPHSPAPGLVELDPLELAEASIDVASAVLAESGPVDALGIANQRASAIAWNRRTGVPVGPGIGWQDLRTVGRCLALANAGVRVMPNASATKFEHLLDHADPDRADADLLVGTVETWLTWRLTEGAAHVTDASNAAVTGLRTGDNADWSERACAELRIPRATLPEVVDSSGVVGQATVLDGSPPIAGLVGDQQASLLGQGCVRPGMAKITFGTGGMLDVCLGEPPTSERGAHGTFPIVAWRLAGRTTWGLEAVMLAAGTNVEWLRDGLGLVGTAAGSHDVAATVDDSGGVVFVPALSGLGTPWWDHGSRGALFGVTRGTSRAHVVRAVLEGVAQRGADLVEAAEADAAVGIERLRIDGGMTANPTFVQALADASGRPVEVAPVAEATTHGAAFLAGLAVGIWSDLDEVAATWRPAQVVEPRRSLDRDRWLDAVERARRWVPELSSLEF